MSSARRRRVRDSSGHFLNDTARNRELIQGIIKPENATFAKQLNNGSTLTTYRFTQADGTQIWG